MIDRVSTLGLSHSTLRSAMSVQSRYAAATASQSSGLVCESYTGLGADAARLISTESLTARLTAWQRTTQTATDRAQSMYSAVGDIIDRLDSLRVTLSAARSSDGSDTSLDDTGAGMLEDLAALMNTRLDGRYLFAGSRTDTAPIAVAALAVPTSPSSADTSYYQGDDEAASVRVSDQQSLTYGVTADSPAFEQALRAANILANLTTAPLDTTAIEDAYDLATAAIDGMIALQSGLATVSERLEAATARQKTGLSLLETMATATKSVDAAEMAIKLADYQTILEASYSALGGISRVSLVKYL